MSEIVGRELKNWQDSLDITDLNDYDITVINIIINHYEELIAAGGTAAGKRAKKFAEYVNEKNGICDKKMDTLSFRTIEKTKKIKRITKLSVDSFRGFAVSREFDLNKQYVFLYGPNGSGKSSFSEALEYGLLETIQEAEANKIKLPIYIKNTLTKKGNDPEILCIFDDDTKDKVIPDYESYRFAFVEKNRISDFSHISVLNSKNQSERISALFGLSVFNDFVQGFTTNFGDNYLSIKFPTEDSFKEAKTLRDGQEKQIKVIEEELEKLRDLSLNTIRKLGKEEISNIDVALDYLHNPQNGILTMKITDRDKNYKEPLSIEKIDTLQSIIKEISEGISSLTNYRNELSDKSLQVNYKTLYEAIATFQETDTCPACGTPIENATRNPYLYAKEQLKSFSELEKLQEDINTCTKDIKLNIQEAINFFDKNIQLLQQICIDTSVAIMPDTEEIRTLGKKIVKWESLCKDIIEIDKTSISIKLNKYNDVANKSNESYEEQVKKYTDLNNQLLTLKAQISDKEQQIESLKKEIEKFDKESAEILIKIQKEKELGEFNQKIIVAYDKVIHSMIRYNEELPKKISKDLEEKIVDYYNTINQDDADFEKIKKIALPDADSDKLMVVFKDGNKAEALQVLSEGHIKILGLSILLAKAVHDKLNFIVFDDIVNAIDDDHRNGVANLLMNHADFFNIQIILSTHGDQFIYKLQDKLGQERYKKYAKTYKFIPADSLVERGVIAEYSDAKAPLDAAGKKYEENEIKDAASKCRQAMECIAYNLWNVLAKTPNGMISVGMRSPKAIPDLNSIVEGLIKKTNKIQGMENIHSELVCLKKENNWRVLNKGTHHEDEQKEFDRSDVKKIIDHLNNLDGLVRNVKLEAIVLE